MTADAALALLIALLENASKLGALIQKARAEGRDITDDELDALAVADDEARKKLEDAIQRARDRETSDE